MNPWVQTPSGEVYPAKLQCTYTFGNFCHECYARKHVKVLPKYLDLKPVKIDYRLPGGTSGSALRAGACGWSHSCV